MFKKLTDFGYHRTGKEAFGFYLAYFLFVILAGAVVGGLLGSLIPDAAYENGFRVGSFVSVISSLGLSYLIIQQKKQTSNFRFIILGLISGVLGLFGGSLLGLIIPAYLTTQQGKGHVVSNTTSRVAKPRARAKAKTAKK